MIVYKQFMCEDDYRGDFANPISMNRYTYTHNNPVMEIDPSGLRPIDHGPKIQKSRSNKVDIKRR